MGRVDLGGEFKTVNSAGPHCSRRRPTLTQLVSMGNIDKYGRYRPGEIEIPVEISIATIYGSMIIVVAMIAGKQPSLKSSLHSKVEDNFENLV